MLKRKQMGTERSVLSRGRAGPGRARPGWAGLGWAEGHVARELGGELPSFLFGSWREADFGQENRCGKGEVSGVLEPM